MCPVTGQGALGEGGVAQSSPRKSWDVPSGGQTDGATGLLVTASCRTVAEAVSRTTDGIGGRSANPRIWMVSECTCRCGQLAQECPSSQVALGKMTMQVGVDREAFDEPCPAWSIRVRRVGRVAPVLRVEDNSWGRIVERP